MDAIAFTSKYQSYINTIEKLSKVEYKSIIDELKETDPHDLVKPDTFFLNESQAIGFVYSLFINKVITR
jgi:threonine aldolase